MTERRRKTRRKRNNEVDAESREDERRNEDRREFQRVAAEIMVEVETRGKRTYRRTANIGLGGVGFHAPIPFRLGSQVAMNLRLAGQRGAVRVLGEVVGTDDSGRGTRVRFLDLSNAASDMLEQHLTLFEAPTHIVVSPFKGRQPKPKPEPVMKVREGILILQGEFAGHEFRLRSADKVVGRDAKSADLVIEDPTVSRRHAHIYLQNGRHVITDLSSTNGIKFRGKPIRSLVLKDGMQFKIGMVQVQYLVTRAV
ncbi:MAG: FHA domain-containing protein [Deltaproteobacteria bacterium]|nr:FHA domain-containing protein [Deltaproteobacteria bacterium]